MAPPVPFNPESMLPPPPLNPEFILLLSLYPVFTFLACLLIYLKTRKIEELSFNKGVKYFRRAFLFLGISFPIMFLLMSVSRFIGEENGYPALRDPFGAPLGRIGSRYFVLVCSFYLLYSLLWKKFDFRKNRLYRFLEPSIFVVSLLVIGIDMFTGHVFSTLLLLILLSHIALMSYSNYTKSRKKQKLPWYPLSLLLFSLMWGIQFFALLFRGLSPIFRVYTMLSTPVILLTVLYLVHKATKGK